jgi:hypothetical protein
MSIFSNILTKLFPASHPATTAEQTPGSSTSSQAGAAGAPASSAAPGQQAPQPRTVPPVDIEAVISAMPGASTLNWRTSIVDLLKVLGLDSSMESRQQLAHELGYTGSTSDSAQMNIWLHKEVVSRVAANGGKVPDSMKA